MCAYMCKDVHMIYVGMVYMRVHMIYVGMVYMRVHMIYVGIHIAGGICL